jgi:hypothetical protein
MRPTRIVDMCDAAQGLVVRLGLASQLGKNKNSVSPTSDLEADGD